VHTGRGLLARAAWAAAVALAAAHARADSLLLPSGTAGSGPADGASRVESLRRAARTAAERGREPAGGDLPQVLVVPERPGRNNVRYYDFDWKRWDYLDDRGTGGVRFYFYEREEEVARIAAALVRDQYEMLAARFNYRPTSRVPYILYNSHREFEATNVFFVNEYILGVTSPQDLRMALPYWGEIERFREVSTHEMAHQFTIQKVADRAAALGQESPVNLFPLWFVEGLAEYYAKNGVDLETDAFARDLLVEPHPEKGYSLWGFWEDDPKGYIPTYKLGQLRVAFLADAFGERIVQGILDQSPRLGSGGRGQTGGEREDFKALVSRLAGEKPERIAERFSSWMKRRYLPGYLATRQEPPTFQPVELAGEPDAFVTARDGYTMLYRTVERDSGRARLHLADRRSPDSTVQVAVDGQPGMESLHPVLRGVAAVAQDRLAFFARDGSADALYVVPFERRGEGVQTRLRLGSRRRIDLGSADLIEAGDPVFSPAGDRVAFLALDGTGRSDLWTADVASGKLARLTNDLYAEREPSWTDEPPGTFGIDTAAADAAGPADGTLVFTCDATADRRYNLVALDPRTGARARLTDEPADHRAPYALGGGLVVFSTDARGKQDLHLYGAVTHRVARITDFVTMLTAPSPGPRGLMALGFHGGRYRIFDVPTETLLALDERPAIVGVPEPPAPFPQEPIPPQAEAYHPYRSANWKLENGVAAVGAAAGGQVGQGALLFGDVLGDRNVLVQLGVYGSLSLTDALAFFVNRSGRQVWGGGPFHTFTQRREPDAPGLNADVLYLQREFGLTGLWSYPFDTFTRFEVRGAVQGELRSFEGLVDPTTGGLDLRVPLAGLRAWDAARGGLDYEGLAAVRLGFDTTRYRFPGGAFGGMSALAEVGGGYLPSRGQVHRYATADAQYHYRFFGWPVLHLRAAAGASGGSAFARQFFLSSYDNLRQFYVSDRRLLGTDYMVGNADLHLPLDAVVKLAIFSTITGVIGADFGSVSERIGDLWPTRSMSFVLGFNLGLGPFEVRVHFAKPIDVGGIRLPPDWVPNVSLRYLYF